MGKPRTMGADGEDCTFATRDTSVVLGTEDPVGVQCRCGAGPQLVHWCAGLEADCPSSSKVARGEWNGRQCRSTV